MDATLQQTCELLRAIQNPEDAVRKEAEKKIDEALDSAPDQLTQGLLAVLSTADDGMIPMELRQEAAVLLRQIVAGTGHHAPVWTDLISSTRESLKAQLLVAIQKDPSKMVRKNAGNAVASIAEALAEDFDELMQRWPELLPALSQFVAAGSEQNTRVTALGVLKELADTVGEGLVKQEAIGMLQQCLQDASPEVRAAAAQLTLTLIEEVTEDEAKPLQAVMPAVITTLQVLATSASNEELLTETLEALIAAADEEPEFFQGACFKDLWNLLMGLCGAQFAADAEARHSGMEAAISLACGLIEQFMTPEGLPALEQLIALNVEWMLEVEEDVDVWTAAADNQNDDDEDDDIDGEAMKIGEENLDRLAEECAEKLGKDNKLEECFMPTLFKVIRSALQSPGATWRHTRSCVMAVSQVIEHLEEEDWISQCVEFILGHVGHPHPRVRFAVFQAIGQAAYDHEPFVQENHYAEILPAVTAGLDDTNIRVATNAATAFGSLGEEIDKDYLVPYADDLMTKFFARLHQGQTRSMQEACLSGIAVVSSASEELFAPYYPTVMPVLKQIIANSTKEDVRMLRCKAFECTSFVGEAVGKEMFAGDAHEVMQVMTQSVQTGFAPDDPTREYIFETAGRIAKILEQDFKPYLHALLPPTLAILDTKPKEMSAEDVDEDDLEEQEDMSLMFVGGQVLSLKTSVLSEMKDSLSTLITFIGALGDEFVDFMPATCQKLLPMLGYPLSAEVRTKTFKAWEVLAECARESAEKGKIDPATLRELVGNFLKTTVQEMTKVDGSSRNSLSMLRAQAMGVSGVVEKAGKGVLGKEDVVGLVTVLNDIITKLPCDPHEEAPTTKGRARADSDDMSDDSDEDVASSKTVRLAVADIIGSLMHSNPQEFAEVGLPVFIDRVSRLLKSSQQEEELSFALYITDDVVDVLGELSIPYWNSFMNEALNLIGHKSSAVRQYACSTIGNAAQQQIFAQMAPAAAQRIAQLLRTHGERHRRRRANNPKAKEVALSIDAAIRAFGKLCEHHEQTFGADAAQAWNLWLTNLPLRYDRDEGQKAHAQLLELVVKSHPVVTSVENIPRVLAILADVYKTHFSNGLLDMAIAAAVSKTGEDTVRKIASELPDKQTKKVEQMLKDGADKA